MKKILTLLGVVSLLPFAANAEIYENATVDEFRAQKYSESMIRAVDTTLDMHQSHGGKYQRRYPNRVKKNFFGNIHSHIKLYFDPIQDDGKFGEHEINFSNNWMGEETKYNRPFEDRKKAKELENL